MGVQGGGACGCPECDSVRCVALGAICDGASPSGVWPRVTARVCHCECELCDCRSDFFVWLFPVVTCVTAAGAGNDVCGSAARVDG